MNALQFNEVLIRAFISSCVLEKGKVFNRKKLIFLTLRQWAEYHLNHNEKSLPIPDACA